MSTHMTAALGQPCGTRPNSCLFLATTLSARIRRRCMLRVSAAMWSARFTLQWTSLSQDAARKPAPAAKMAGSVTTVRSVTPNISDPSVRTTARASTETARSDCLAMAHACRVTATGPTPTVMTVTLITSESTARHFAPARARTRQQTRPARSATARVWRVWPTGAWERTATTVTRDTLERTAQSPARASTASSAQGSTATAHVAAVLRTGLAPTAMIAIPVTTAPTVPSLARVSTASRTPRVCTALVRAPRALSIGVALTATTATMHISVRTVQNHAPVPARTPRQTPLGSTVMARV